MSYLLFSDLHLTPKPDKSRLKYLLKLLDKYQNVYILGDLFEGYVTNPKNTVNSFWKPFFSLLAEKNTYMFVGNHDKSTVKSLKDLNIFKDVFDDYLLMINKKKFYLCHGHRFYKSIDVFFKCLYLPIVVTKLLLKIIKFEKSANKKGQETKLRKDFIAYEQVDRSILSKFKIEFSKDTTLICGHTHNPLFDLKNNYINVGFINFGFASYLKIDDLGNLSFVTETY